MVREEVDRGLIVECVRCGRMQPWVFVTNAQNRDGPIYESVCFNCALKYLIDLVDGIRLRLDRLEDWRALMERGVRK